jgi:hypothetical protein
MAGSLSDSAVRCIAFVEQTFWMTGSVPTQDVLVERLGLSKQTVKKYFEDETFRTALRTRGVDLSPEQSTGLLTIQQLTLANILLNLHDKRSVRQKLDEVGVSSQQYHVWLKDPAFSDYMRKRAEDLFQGKDHEVYIALLNNATNGDDKAIQLFFEMRGIYNPKLQVEVNLEQVLQKVIEIIARHVQDPATLAAIADDMDLLDTGAPRRGALSPPKALETTSTIVDLGGL